MKLLPKPRFKQVRIMKQRGVVLFFALIALVVMSLAAVALIRSVDTSTMIAGNLAFKQAATTSGDAGTESAIAWLSATTITMSTANLEIFIDTGHAFNNDGGVAGYVNADGTACCQNAGYFSSVGPSLSLTDGTFNWNNGTLVGTGTDGSGNTIRYVIQRMCRNANQVLSKTNCLFSAAALDNNGKEIPLPQDICSGPGCPAAGQAPQYRITARVTGPKNTVSYIQSFVY